MPTIQRKPVVIVTRKLPDAVETRMCELFDTRLNAIDKPMTAHDLAEAVKVADVLVPTVTDRIDRSILTQAGSQLRLIANFGTGVDNVDLDTARNRGILVTNTPGVLTEDTADMTMALILAVPRRIYEGASYLKDPATHWTGWSPTWMLGHRIYGKRLGIIGMGRIGQAVARRARAFGLQIHYHNRRRLPEAPQPTRITAVLDQRDKNCSSAPEKPCSPPTHSCRSGVTLLRPILRPTLRPTLRLPYTPRHAAPPRCRLRLGRPLLEDHRPANRLPGLPGSRRPR